ncbi:MAG: hypothetical protein ACEY3D_02510 [Rickettsia sp.]
MDTVVKPRYDIVIGFLLSQE